MLLYGTLSNTHILRVYRYLMVWPGHSLTLFIIEKVSDRLSAAATSQYTSICIKWFCSIVNNQYILLTIPCIYCVFIFFGYKLLIGVRVHAVRYTVASSGLLSTTDEIEKPTFTRPHCWNFYLIMFRFVYVHMNIQTMADETVFI